MSNRTDFDRLSRDLAEMFSWSDEERDRVATELHNAFVAGEEADVLAVSERMRQLANDTERRKRFEGFVACLGLALGGERWKEPERLKLALVKVNDDGSGRQLCLFDAKEFLEDLEAEFTPDLVALREAADRADKPSDGGG